MDESKPKPFVELDSDVPPVIGKCEDGEHRRTWRGFKNVVSA
jgi:hypothetical protein